MKFSVFYDLEALIAVPEVFLLENLILSLIKYKHTSEGITIIAVIIKNNPQFPSSQSTMAPDEEAKRVLPIVPIEANSAYCVAV